MNLSNRMSDQRIQKDSVIQNPTTDITSSKTNKQIKQEEYFAKRDFWLRKNELDQKWLARCDAQKKLIRDFPTGRYAKLPSKVYDAVFTKSFRNIGDKNNFFRIDAKNFEEPMRCLLSAEEATEHTEMRKFDLKNWRVWAVPGDQKCRVHYQCQIAGLSKGIPSVIPTDSVVVFDGSNYCDMIIVDILGDLLTFRPKNGKPVLQIANRRFDLSLVPGGLNFDRYNIAIKDVMKDPRASKMIFGGDPLIDDRSGPKIKRDESQFLKLEERIKKCNKRQQQAVANILKAECRPHLYILFGPPGTGKTFTLVEAIVQIYKRAKDVRILVCSGSNLCVDALAKSICDTKQVDSLKRLSSLYHYKQCFELPDYFCTELREVARSRVVVTTNVMASKFFTKRYFFDYVMIDEAGHSHIPESLIPISKLKQDGLVVLAGDPKQLGPVIKSSQVKRLGLGISLLESLCELEMYSRDHEGQYNERFITKLIESYRCDPRILGLCNELFYHGDLECFGKTPTSIMRILKFEKPLVMAQVRGVEMTPKSSTSRLNKLEAKACIELVFRLYRMGLEPSQIGVITPYLLQKDALQVEFDRRLKQETRLLEERFKLPPLPSPKDSEKESELGAPKSKPPTQSEYLSDLDLLTETLNRMRLQANAIKEDQNQKEIKLINKTGRKIDWHCKIDTVDAFQGSEREVIIVSTVRTPSNAKIQQNGFIADAKRFNVAISRAKWLVITVGHPAVLECNLWKQYGQHSTWINMKKF